MHRRLLSPVPLRLDSHVWFSCQGVTSILPVLREGVLTGSPEQKEEAAKALGLVIRLTSADALRPSVVSITGPLIRILGDRFSWNVKAALLETLSLLLAKVSHLCVHLSVRLGLRSVCPLVSRGSKVTAYDGEAAW